MTANERDFLIELGNSTEIIEMASTPARLYILVANLQLALRHPGNNGASAEIAREIAFNMTDAICAYFPEARETIEAGWNPSNDMTRAEFGRKFEESENGLDFLGVKPLIDTADNN